LYALSLSLTLALAAGPALSQVLPITSGDRLDVVVSGEGQLSRVYTVDQDGNIFLDLIGKVPVKDRMPSQVRDEIAKRLGQFIKAPQVSVDFRERAQVTVGFTGEVGKPGNYLLMKGKRLLDGLAQAEGLRMTADSHNVRFQRRGEAAPKILDLSRVLEKDASLNVELLDGDTLYVPALPIYNIQVLGAVNKPDMLVRKEKLRLVDAILAAGGFTEEANRRSVELLRKGTPEAEIFNLDSLLAGKDGNPLLEDGDIVRVPAFRKVSVKVYGSVAKPGVYQVREGATLEMVINDAGGFQPDANKTAITLKELAGPVRKLSVPEVNSPDASIVVPDGAEVTVAPLLRFAITGSGVPKPEIYPLPDDGKTKFTFLTALTLAGGPIDRAKKKHIYLIRRGADGSPDPQEIDFEKVLKKKAEDPVIMPNDVIFVDADPDNKQKQTLGEKIAPWLRLLPFGAF